LRAAGYTAIDMADMNGYGYTRSELQAAGFTDDEIPWWVQ
jgi:hypothetical protein